MIPIKWSTSPAPTPWGNGRLVVAYLYTGKEVYAQGYVFSLEKEEKYIPDILCEIQQALIKASNYLK